MTLVSILSPVLRYGTLETALVKSVARPEDGSPASPVGELIDVIVKEVEASNRSYSQGKAEPDVQAADGQTEEGGVGAIYGLVEIVEWKDHRIC